MGRNDGNVRVEDGVNAVLRSATLKECSLALCPTLCRDKKIQKVSNARFFRFLQYCDAPQVYIKSSNLQ